MYDDIQETDVIQIIPVNVIGEWDLKPMCHTLFWKIKKKLNRHLKKYVIPLIYPLISDICTYHSVVIYFQGWSC